MLKWYSTSFATKPNANPRQNYLIVDFSTDEPLGGSAMENAVNAVNLIVQQHAGPYTLLASGGVDSQAMILAWKQAGVPFSVVHYNYGTNIEDIETLVSFCCQHGVPVSIRFFEAQEFIESQELIELAKKYDCSSPQILTYIRFTMQHPETCVMAGNFIGLQGGAFNWTIEALQRFAEADKPNFIPFFLTSTPQLAYSFLTREVENKRAMLPDHSEYEIKVATYRDCGFDVMAQSDKRTGFEAIKALYDSVKPAAKIRLKWAHKPSKRPFDLLYRYSLMDHLADGPYADAFKLVHPAAINTLYVDPKDSTNAIHH